jgi:thioredoxin reductase (NADPH)
VAKPTILTVDDDEAVISAVGRDLKRKYGKDYRVVSATSGAQALEIAGELALRGRPIALIASDQRMPQMTGVEFLEQVRDKAPDAKLVLLTAYADTDVAIKAINDIGLDYYLQKPWTPPEEKLYPVLDDLLGDWQANHPDDLIDLRVVGHRWSDRSHEIKTFLARNRRYYQWLELDRDDEAQRLLELSGAAMSELPLVLIPDTEPLRAPSTLALADALGMRTRTEQDLYDLCVVGGGPAGLAAAVYGASEGLQTVVIECEALGGQAGQSAAIENYLGFPKGLTGRDLTHRAVSQVQRFGGETVLAREVVGLEPRGPVHGVRLAGDNEIEARSVIISTGVSYRMLEAPGLGELAGRGVFYGATASEAQACEGEDVYIVGAANSAGQAALNFARYARRVVLLVRGDSLEKAMSLYLADRCTAHDKIEVRLQTEVAAGRGSDHLEEITLLDRGTGTKEDVTTNWLFAFIGAQPRTGWLGDGIVRDERGFVVTGTDLLTGANDRAWSLSRPPFALETSVPGVFAAGDVRLDSMKRVAAAVGEGAMAVYFVHRYLANC